VARRRQRAIDLAVLQAETAQLQVEPQRAELTGLHQELARRHVELISALTRVAAVTDRLRLQTEQDRDDHHRLTRAIELLTMFIASPPPALSASDGSDPTPPRASTASDRFTEVVPTEPASGVGTVIGGSIDPSLLTVDGTAPADPAPDAVDVDTPARAIDLTSDLLADLPIAPATREERPLRCEVHLQFGDRWIDGFQIEETVHDGDRTRFRLRRRVDGWVLPELFDESEVRVFTQPVVDGV
jgi:hypothetical protein